MSTQTPCSRICVEPAASVVDAQRFGMGPPRCLEDDSGCIVLHTLQLLDAADWRAVQYRVAVVQSRQNQAAGQCLCQIGRQQVAHVVSIPHRRAKLILQTFISQNVSYLQPLLEYNTVIWSLNTARDIDVIECPA